MIEVHFHFLGNLLILNGRLCTPVFCPTRLSPSTYAEQRKHSFLVYGLFDQPCCQQANVDTAVCGQSELSGVCYSQSPRQRSTPCVPPASKWTEPFKAAANASLSLPKLSLSCPLFRSSACGLHLPQDLLSFLKFAACNRPTAVLNLASANDALPGGKKKPT